MFEGCHEPHELVKPGWFRARVSSMEEQGKMIAAYSGGCEYRDLVRSQGTHGVFSPYTKCASV